MMGRDLVEGSHVRFSADVRWSPEGVLEGEIAFVPSPPVPFHGVIQLVGLVEAKLGPPPPPSVPGALSNR